MTRANLLINGCWEKNVDLRGLTISGIRNWIKADGSTDFTPEAGRYHLYVSDACPWSHRVMLMHKLKKLNSLISISTVDTTKADEGWRFSDTNFDLLFSYSYLHQVYTRHDSLYTGRVSVPILWDKKTNKIVSNESADIMIMLNSEFNRLLEHNTPDYYPEYLQSQIDKVNDIIYPINLGVYKCGLANTDAEYEQAKKVLFHSLDNLDQMLKDQYFLIGNQLTTADLRLFVTLIRFDQVYFHLFKCNEHRIEDYENLSRHTKMLYQQPQISDTTNFSEIMNHYFSSFPQLDIATRPENEIPRFLRELVKKSSCDKEASFTFS